LPVPHASPREVSTVHNTGQVANLSQGGKVNLRPDEYVSLLKPVKGRDKRLKLLNINVLRSSQSVVKYLELVICCQAQIMQRVHHFG
jgi:hypothetical protein